MVRPFPLILFIITLILYFYTPQSYAQLPKKSASLCPPGQTALILSTATLTARPGRWNELGTEDKLAWPKTNEIVNILKKDNDEDSSTVILSDFDYDQPDYEQVFCHVEYQKPGEGTPIKGYLPLDSLDVDYTGAPSDDLIPSSKTTEDDCHSCEEGIHTNNQCELLKMMEQITLHNNESSLFKNNEDLSKYFYLHAKGRFGDQCPTDNPKIYQLYQEQYKKWISMASNSFKIPESFLSCLIFQESQFNSRAVSKRLVKTRRGKYRSITSPSSARGLGQIQPDAWKEVHNAFSSSWSEDQYKQQKDKVLALKACQMNPEDCTTLMKNRKPSGVKNDINYITSRIQNFERHQMMSDYLNQVNQEASGQNQQSYNLAGFPSNYMKHVFQPELNIAATAAYLRLTLERVTTALELEGFQPNDDPKMAQKILLLTSAGFNAGVWSFLNSQNKQLARKLKAMTLKEMIQYVSKNLKPTHKSGFNEVEAYLKSIKNCIEKDNYEPKWSNNTTAYTNGTQRGQQCLNQIPRDVL